MKDENKEIKEIKESEKPERGFQKWVDDAWNKINNG